MSSNGLTMDSKVMLFIMELYIMFKYHIGHMLTSKAESLEIQCTEPQNTDMRDESGVFEVFTKERRLYKISVRPLNQTRIPNNMF